jgi:hypothetical protein
MKRLILLFALASSLFGANNGTVVGTPTYGAVKFTNGLTATSDANHITLPTAVASSLSGSFGFDLWISTTSVAGLEIAYSFGSNWIGTYNGTAAYDVFGSGFVTLGPINDGLPHHFALTVTTNTVLRIFIDGVVGVAGGCTCTNPGAVISNIGNYGASVGFGFSGKADELAIWTTDKYTANFTPPASAYAGTETNLLALYHLEADGTDSVGGGSTSPPNRTGAHISGGNFAY